MIMPIRIPPMPPFNDDPESRARYAEAMRAHREECKNDEAVMIVAASVITLLIAAAFLYGSHLVWGVNGPLGVVAGFGLLALAVVEVRKRL